MKFLNADLPEGHMDGSLEKKICFGYVLFLVATKVKYLSLRYVDWEYIELVFDHFTIIKVIASLG